MRRVRDLTGLRLLSANRAVIRDTIKSITFIRTLKTTKTMTTNSSRTVPEIYEGLWRRRAIHRSNGTSDLTTAVWWFQSPSYHIDLRVPVNARPEQKTGFAGITVMTIEDGKERCEWRPEIAFPVLSDEIDAGFMVFKTNNELHEAGVDGSYDEDWYREENGEMITNRSVESDGAIHYSIEGSLWKAVARGRPTDNFEGHRSDSSRWTEISVFQKTEGSWQLVASTTRHE